MQRAQLDQDFLNLIGLRNQLTGLDYSDPVYDEVEDALSEAEDAFNEEYGPYLEEKLKKIHEAHFPGQDVLLPTAYMATSYTDSVVEEGSYELPMDEGIMVDWEAAGRSLGRAKVVMVPSPLRFMLFDGESLHLLWSVQDEEVYHSPLAQS